MIPYRIQEEALAEAAHALRHYVEVHPDLARRYSDDLQATIRAARIFPQTGYPMHDGFRRKAFRKFPYLLIYAIEEGLLVVYAIPHKRQRPGYWTGRKKK